MSAHKNRQPQSLPYVEVVEQPAQNSHRFRYQCEGRNPGCIVGVDSCPKNKTYPSIKVHNYEGPAVIVISCVTNEDNPMVHPHSIGGKTSCKKGICTLEVNLNGNAVSISNLGINCVKKNQVIEALEIKKKNRIDPFNNGFAHMNYPDSIDLNTVKLAFQVFIPGLDKKCSVPLNTVATLPIYDKKMFPELMLVEMSHDKAPVSGGMEIILLCEKVPKQDIQVRFFEIRNEMLYWDGYGKFMENDVYKHVAITFKTPRYRNQNISEPVKVYVQLRRKSDGTTSNSLPFKMMPLNPNHVNSHNINNIDKIESLKRKRMKSCNSNLLKELKMQNQNTDSMEPTLKVRADCNIPFNQQQHSKRDNIVFHEPRISSPQSNPQPKLQPHRHIEHPLPNVTINSYAYREPRFTNYRQEESKQAERKSSNQETQIGFNLDNTFDLDVNTDNVKSQDLALFDNIDTDIFENLSENLSKGLSISDHIEDTQQINLEQNKDNQASQQQQEQQHQQQQQQHAVNFFQNNERNFNVDDGSYNAFPKQTFRCSLRTQTDTQYF